MSERKKWVPPIVEKLRAKKARAEKAREKKEDLALGRLVRAIRGAGGYAIIGQGNIEVGFHGSDNRTAWVDHTKHPSLLVALAVAACAAFTQKQEPAPAELPVIKCGLSPEQVSVAVDAFMRGGTATAAARATPAPVAPAKPTFEPKGEWHRARCPERGMKPEKTCDGNWAWIGVIAEYDYGPANEFVGKTCAQVCDAEVGGAA